MSEEIKIKVSQPMFEDGELERFDTYINEIANEFTKLHFAEKEKILTQRLVQKLEQEIKDLKEQVEYQDLWRNEYSNRIDKAIEYIRTHRYPTNYCFSEEDLDKQDLINILEGE